MFNKRCENRENSRNEQLFSLILGIVEFYLYRGAGIIRKINNKKLAAIVAWTAVAGGLLALAFRPGKKQAQA